MAEPGFPHVTTTTSSGCFRQGASTAQVQKTALFPCPPVTIRQLKEHTATAYLDLISNFQLTSHGLDRDSQRIGLWPRGHKMPRSDLGYHFSFRSKAGQIRSKQFA